MNRRKFIHHASTGAFASVLAPTIALPVNKGVDSHFENPLRIGIVADVHCDLMPDARERLEVFISKAMDEQLDFIIQMGDFCMGIKENDSFMNIWNTFPGPKYHVLGNHDMDKNSKEEMLDYWEMPDPYYSFDFNGVHFIILDANHMYQGGKYVDYDHANFYVDDTLRTFINTEQIEWFKADLQSTKLPTIIFSHQSLWHYQWGVKNRLAIQRIMEAQVNKIICCMNGHNHIDFHHIQNGINYLEINSMSYHWLQGREHYLAKQSKVHDEKTLPNMALYQDPLYAIATLDQKKGSLELEGTKSQWVSPSPEDLEIPKPVLGSAYTPVISDYELNF